MDPAASLDIINDPDFETEDRVCALLELASWLKRGGFVPFGRSIDDAVVEEFQGDDLCHLHDLAAAVRCAIANDDLSGLEPFDV